MTEKPEIATSTSEKSHSTAHHQCPVGCECPCSMCQVYRDAYQGFIDHVVPLMAADADARAFYLLTGEWP